MLLKIDELLGSKRRGTKRFRSPKLLRRIKKLFRKTHRKGCNIQVDNLNIHINVFFTKREDIGQLIMEYNNNNHHNNLK